MKGPVALLVVLALLGAGAVGAQGTAGGGEGEARVLTAPVNPFEVRFVGLEPPTLGAPWTVRVAVLGLQPALGATLRIVADEPLSVLGPDRVTVAVQPGVPLEVPFQLLLSERREAMAKVELDYREEGAHYFPYEYAFVGFEGDRATVRTGVVAPWTPPEGLEPAPRTPGAPPFPVGDAAPPGRDEVPAPRAAGTVTVVGQVQFLSTRTGDTGFKGIFHAVVEIWDQDDLNPDDLLATVCTDGNGNFNSGPLDQGDQAGTLDLYFKVRTACSPGVELRNGGGSRYTFTNSDATLVACKKGVQVNVPDGTFDFRQCNAPATQNDWWTMHDFAEQAIMLAWNQGYNPGIVKLDVPATGHAGAEYHPDSDTIHIPDATYKDGPDVLTHEVGHFLMDKVYGSIPPAPNCSPHSINTRSSQGCAWVEGWANYVAVQSFVGTTRWRDDSGTYNAPTFSYGFEANPLIDRGDDVEGSVAGALWDLSDDVDETYDDVDAWAWSHVWARFVAGASDNTFPDYRGSWTASHSTRDFVQVAFQNGIDYDAAVPVTTHTSPNGGGFLQGTVTLTATSTDSDSGIRKVEFYWSIDSSCSILDTLIGSDSTAPYSIQWDTRPLLFRPENSIWLCDRGQSVDGTFGAFDVSDGAGFGILPGV